MIIFLLLILWDFISVWTLILCDMYCSFKYLLRLLNKFLVSTCGHSEYFPFTLQFLFSWQLSFTHGLLDPSKFIDSAEEIWRLVFDWNLVKQETMLFMVGITFSCLIVSVDSLSLSSTSHPFWVQSPLSFSFTYTSHQKQNSLFLMIKNINKAAKRELYLGGIDHKIILKHIQLFFFDPIQLTILKSFELSSSLIWNSQFCSFSI